MHLLATVGKRLWDAVTAFVGVLSGRVTPRKLSPTARVRHAAALQADLLEVASLLEKMHAWTSRMAARDSRAAKKLLEEFPGDDQPGVAAGSVAPPVAPGDRKMQLRRFMTARAMGLDGVPPPYVPGSATRVNAVDDGGVPGQAEIFPDDENGDEP
jgi:hypothetical protein